MGTYAYVSEKCKQFIDNYAEEHSLTQIEAAHELIFKKNIPNSEQNGKNKSR